MPKKPTAVRVGSVVPVLNQSDELRLRVLSDCIIAYPVGNRSKDPPPQRVFAEKALWLRCSSLIDRWRVCSLVSPRQRAFSAKTGPRRILKQALKGSVSALRPFRLWGVVWLRLDRAAPYRRVGIGRALVGCTSVVERRCRAGHIFAGTSAARFWPGATRAPISLCSSALNLGHRRSDALPRPARAREGRSAVK